MVATGLLLAKFLVPATRQVSSYDIHYDCKLRTVFAANGTQVELVYISVTHYVVTVALLSKW